MFRRYQHVERFGKDEVAGIELGKCYIFPKLDGTNASVWYDEKNKCVQCGSRNKQLFAEKDNAGFYQYVKSEAATDLRNFCKKNPHLIVYGEWLVPHSLKTYRENAWREFYVFDIYDKLSNNYLTYELMCFLLEDYEICIVPVHKIINNPSYEQLINCTKDNTFLIEEGHGVGEGIVIKNYYFVNKYGRQTWAKLVTNEFKERHKSAMGPAELDGPSMVEQDIVNKYITRSLVDKELAKIINDKNSVPTHDWIEQQFASKDIPQLLGRVWNCLITEECWNFLKDFKNPTIDFKKLNKLCTLRVKDVRSDLF